jgi:phage I-like protein
MSGTKATLLGASIIGGVSLMSVSAGSPPLEVMVLPAGKTITTVDGRGPYHVGDLTKLAADSLQAAGGKLVMDENHSTDLAGPRGEPSPARGWLTSLEARADGIWAKVDWTDAGKALVSDRVYRGISPVLIHDSSNNVMRIARVSLVNNPNLRGMATLHSEDSKMDELLQQLRDALGLDKDADQAAIIAAVKACKSSAGTALNSALAPIGTLVGVKDAEVSAQTVLAAVKTSLNSQLAPVAQAVGLRADAAAADVLTAVKTLAASNADGKSIVALQGELAAVTTKLNDLTKSQATERATAFVDGQIKSGRVGVKALRDHYISRHAADPAAVEKEITALPILSASGTSPLPPEKDKDGKIALNAEQKSAADALGIDHKQYAETLSAEQENA